MNAMLKALIHHATYCGDKIAFSDEQSDISYQQLLFRVRDVARRLVYLDPHCVALRANNGIDWVVTDLAAMWAGIPIVPVPMFFSEQQTRHLLSESGADVLIGEWHQWHPLFLGQIDSLQVWRLQQPSEQKLLRHTSKVTFTSGSTGKPKGVCLSSQQLVSISTTLAETIAKNVRCDKHLVLLPLSTLLENIAGVYVPILLGATSVVLSGKSVGLTGSSQFDAVQFSLALSQYLPNTMILTPALLLALIEAVQVAPKIAKNLKFVAVGGARVSPSLLEQAHRLGIPAYEGYGLSENASVVSLNTPSKYKSGTSGKPLPHLNVKVSEDGEILVSGNTALGYVNQPFESHWLATGDLGYIDDEGFLVISGRKKNQIISAYGRNISPEWLESEAQAFRELSAMVIVGEGQHTLTAIVESGDIKQVAASLRQFNAAFPDYARIGRVIIAPALRSVPGFYTSNGRPIRLQFEHWARNSAQSEPCHITTQLIE